MIDKAEIKKIYYLLLGIYNSVSDSKENCVRTQVCLKFNDLLEKLNKNINDEMLDYFIITQNEMNGRYLTIGEMKNHVCPIIEYLKNLYIESGDYQISKVGYLYNSIEDGDIKARCGDILLGEGPYDRAINQATQILEDRIKAKAGLKDTNLIGTALVSKAIHSSLDETILKFSDKADIQLGYSNLFKGLVSIYRNPTHHTLSFECSREYALKVCAYIDELLRIIEASEKIK